MANEEDGWRSVGNRCLGISLAVVLGSARTVQLCTVLFLLALRWPKVTKGMCRACMRPVLQPQRLTTIDGLGYGISDPFSVKGAFMREMKFNFL